MFSAYIVEIGEKAAGIVARDALAATNAANQFQFYASSQIFFLLEGRDFPAVAAFRRAIKALWQNGRTRKTSGSSDHPQHRLAPDTQFPTTPII